MFDYEIPYTIIVGILLTWLCIMMNDMYTTNLNQTNRIIRLSYNLQLAEYRSGYPYYSQISMKPMSYETPLLEIYRETDKKIRRIRSQSI